MRPLSLGGIGGTGAVLGRRSTADVLGARRRAGAAEVTYASVGSTLRGSPPPGVHSMEVHRTIDGTLERARSTLRAWAPHTGIDAAIVPGDPPVLGEVVCVVAHWGPIEVCAPNRIVALVDEPARFGFAYATLPGHPESGEELFLAERTDDGRLSLSIVAHAEPVAPAAKLAAPVTRAVQRAAARRYLAAWADAIGAPG